jgi:hypothetical protein
LFVLPTFFRNRFLRFLDLFLHSVLDWFSAWCYRKLRELIERRTDEILCELFHKYQKKLSKADEAGVFDHETNVARIRTMFRVELKHRMKMRRIKEEAMAIMTGRDKRRKARRGGAVSRSLRQLEHALATSVPTLARAMYTDTTAGLVQSEGKSLRDLPRFGRSNEGLEAESVESFPSSSSEFVMGEDTTVTEAVVNVRDPDKLLALLGYTVPDTATLEEKLEALESPGRKGGHEELIKGYKNRYSETLRKVPVQSMITRPAGTTHVEAALSTLPRVIQEKIVLAQVPCLASISLRICSSNMMMPRISPQLPHFPYVSHLLLGLFTIWHSNSFSLELNQVAERM